MSSLRTDSDLDRLLRQAVRDHAAATAPAGSWRDIARTVRHMQAAEADAVQHEMSVLRWLQHRLRQVVRRHGARSWAYGFTITYPLGGNVLTCYGPERACRPGSFAGVAMTQLFDMRLAS